MALMGLGKLDEAASILSALTPTDSLEKAITENNTGYLALLRGRSDQAQEYFEKARDQFKKQGKENTAESARCFANLSLLFWSLGKNSQAEENGLQALQIRQNLFNAESEGVAASFNDLGLVYGSSDADKGISYYEKALVIYEKMYGKEHPKIATANTNLGVMYLKLQLYGDAINHFETALSIWKKTYPYGHPNEALTLVNLGQTYFKMKNNAAALTYFEKALTIYQKNYGHKHPDIASVLNERGSILLSQKKYENALADFQNALIANSPAFQEKAFSKNPVVDHFYNGKVLLYTLDLKAQTLEAQYQGKTLKLSDLKLALCTLQACDSLIDLIRKGSHNENDKIALSELANEVYEDGVRMAWLVSELVIQPTPYREMAFYFAEKSKSAVLQASIADTQAKTYAGIPDGVLEEEKNKKSILAFLSEKLAEKPDEQNEKQLQKKIYDSKQDYDRFIGMLEKQYPAYYNLKYNPSSATVSDIRHLLKPEQALVSYFLSPRKKRIYQFVITKTKFTVTNHTLPDDFDRLCKGFVSSLLYSDFNTYRKTEALQNILKPRVPNSVSELVIIPTGRLGSVPFEALPYQKTKNKKFSTTRYFINRWAISYEFSAGLMLQKYNIKSSEQANNIMLCAPVHFIENNNLSDLPATQTEVENIARLAPKNSKIFTYERANESLLKSKDISNYSILHLATHGMVDANDPSQSEIFLNRQGTEDGNLYGRVIYNLNFNANLVVLSACETGLGKYAQGEGVMGLSRALTNAGAKNMVVSFWKVADESTAALMVSFYKHFLQNTNQNLSKALRDAKLELLSKPAYSSPYYWAPFILIGK